MGCECKNHIERDEFLESCRGIRNEKQGNSENYLGLELTDVNWSEAWDSSRNARWHQSKGIHKKCKETDFEGRWWRAQFLTCSTWGAYRYSM